MKYAQNSRETRSRIAGALVLVGMVATIVAGFLHSPAAGAATVGFWALLLAFLVTCGD